VIVLDPDDRVLLFRVRDVDGTEATWWETPGGGMQRGEDPLATAHRELAEELGHTGLTVVPLGRVDERETSARGARLVKVETLLAARVPTPELDTSGWTAAERRNHLEVRWFGLDELADLELPTVPGDLAAYAPSALETLRAAEAPGSAD
jgi:8-oxo-dGTP pyrophosphatase MutT (NUDIX family)